MIYRAKRDERDLHLSGEKYLLEGPKGVMAIFYDAKEAALVADLLNKEAGAYKQPHELVAMGGHFYQMQGDSYCDTPLDTWKLIPGKGYVKV